jgi:hypothetical protein
MATGTLKFKKVQMTTRTKDAKGPPILSINE